MTSLSASEPTYNGPTATDHDANAGFWWAGQARRGSVRGYPWHLAHVDGYPWLHWRRQATPEHDTPRHLHHT